MISALERWKSLRRSIRSMPEVAKELDKQLAKALYRYRFKLTTLKAKPSRMDGEIWTEFDNLNEEIPGLIARSSGRLIRRPTKLEELLSEWEKLLDRQRDLLTLIDRAFDASDFYNKMEVAKEVKRRQQDFLNIELRQLSQAKQKLIQAVHYIVLREKSGESITGNSVLLDIDEAIDYWEQAIRDLHALESQTDVDIEGLIAQIEFTRDQILKAPTHAEKVRQIEKQLDELLELDAQIKRATQQSSLYEDELSRVLGRLRQNASAHWANAEWVSLQKELELAEEYAQRHIGHARSELYVIRKRSGAPALPVGSGAETQSLGGRPIALSRALEKHRLDRSGQVYIDPDADSSIRYIYQDGSA